MGKNKKLTEEEREIHRKAISLRKLPDKQLVERLEAISNSEKYPPLLMEPTEKHEMSDEEIAQMLSKQSGNITVMPSDESVSEFLTKLKNADIAGIGKVTIKKLYDFARENNYI